MISKELADSVSTEIVRVMQPIPPNDRLGFLVGMVIGGMRAQGLTDDQIREQFSFACDLANTQNAQVLR